MELLVVTCNINENYVYWRPAVSISQS